MDSVLDLSLIKGEPTYMVLYYDSFESPLGTITLVVDGDALCSLDFSDCETRAQELLAQRYGDVELVAYPDPSAITSCLQDYFAGNFEGLAQLKVKLGGTDFQQRVWQQLRKIPCGRTWSYGELAKSLGDKNASRAVGLANSLNPIAIVVPCHRVIGASGQLTGYAGGLERKRWLLQHEGVLLL